VVSTERNDDGVGGQPERDEAAERHDAAESSGAPGPVGTHERRDARERPARRPRLAIAAVAAAVLLAGGGGAWWATAANNDGGDGKASSGAPAPLRLDGPGLSGTVTGGGPSPTDGTGAAYRLTGKLPKGPDEAAVYRASGSVAQADVRRLAALLGMSGAVTSDHDSWRVGGTTDGSGPSLLVSKSAPGTWSYTKYGPPSVGARPDGSTTTTRQPPPSPGGALPKGPAGTTGSGTTGSGTTGSGTTGSGTTGAAPGSDTAPPVSEAAAKAAAAPLLKGLGLSGAKVDASQTVGAVRTVTADPEVGGLPTHGWTTSVQVGADGSVSLGYGRLDALAKGDTYPVVAAATALKELNSTPVMHPDYGVESCQVPTADPGTRSTQVPPPTATVVPPTPGQDRKLPHSLPCIPGGGHSSDVRGAAFGLALQYVSGVQTLVPAWLFDTAPAGVTRTAVVAQTAVEPSYLQSPTPGGPGTVPPATPLPGSSAPSAPPVNPGGPALPANPPGGQSTRHVPVDAYQAKGSALVLSYSGGLCDTYKASAAESGSQVRVSLIATPKPKGTMCPMIIKSFTLRVPLAHPLGTRHVVDTSDGRPVKGQ
jgi:hypothetical protein